MLNAERLLVGALGVGVLDTAYLTWRYIALHAGWVAPGTGLCSWTAGIDCDFVLLSPQARAFYVPNAILGFGFFFGCLLWWMLGRRLGAAYRHHVVRTLAVWLGLATAMTFWFFFLLAHLSHLCPFCPWNHLWTWLALGAAVSIWRATPRPVDAAPVGPLIRLVGICVGQFIVWLAAWQIAYALGFLKASEWRIVP